MAEKRIVDIREIDQEVYESRLEGFLPERMIDVHSHVWRTEFTNADRFHIILRLAVNQFHAVIVITVA